MKYVYIVAGILLGALFLFASLAFFFGWGKDDSIKTPAAEHFLTAIASTNFLKFVKVCELIGGFLVAIPRTRRAGLLILGPIIINILAFHGFIANGLPDLLNPMIIVMVALTLILVFAERKAFALFIGGRPIA